jgi:hypothetical protein
MEDSVPYRKTKLPVKTIPKGTLMFRMTKDTENDTRGVPLEDGTRCLTPHFKVFFYPNPFASELAFQKYLTDYDKNVYVYILTRDIKVFNLLKPSPYTRRDKTRKRFFLKRCSTVKQGCLTRPLNDYDACFSDTIIKKYPNIVGYIANVWSDSVYMKQNLYKPENIKYKKYFHFASDATNVRSVPEIALYPLAKRSPKDVIVKPDDKLENNYKILKTFNRNDKKSIMTFMEKHTTYDPETFHYVYKE